MTEDGRTLRRCADCGGAALTLAVVKAKSGPAFAQDLWSLAQPAAECANRDCPECHRRMETVLAGPSADVEIDLCRTCQMLWFDAGELDQMPRRATVGEMPLEARRALALAKVAEIGNIARDRDAARTEVARRLSHDLRRGTWYRDEPGVWDAVSLLVDALLFWWD